RDAALRARADAEEQRKQAEIALKEANLANSARLTQAAMNEKSYPKKALQIGLHAACLLGDNLGQFDTSSPTYKALLNAARELNAVGKVEDRVGTLIYDIAWSKGGQLAVRIQVPLKSLVILRYF